MACVANRSTTVRKAVRPMIRDRSTMPGECACTSVACGFIGADISAMARLAGWSEEGGCDAWAVGQHGGSQDVTSGNGRLLALVTSGYMLWSCGSLRTSPT